MQLGITTRKDNKPEINEIDPIKFLIPDCCREGWDSCRHVVKKQKPAKKNIGL